MMGRLETGHLLMLLTLLRRFLAARDGNIAMMFGFLALPMIGLAGAGLDYARYINRMQQIQAAVDAAALEGAKVTSTSDFTKGTTAAKSMFNANVVADTYSTVSGITVTQSGNNLVVTATGTVNTTLTQVFGYSTMGFTVTAQANYIQPWLEIMLVMDITGSMNSSGKLTAMKNAATTMVNTLFADSQISPRLSMGIVPFNSQVNIGTGYAGSWWLRTDSTGLNTSDGTPYDYGLTRTICTWWCWQTTSAWTGCLSDRDTPYDQSNAPPVAGTNATLYRAASCEYTTPQTVPLTTSSTTLKTLINSLSANGGTSIPIGLQTGFAILTPGAPFNSSSSDTTRTIKRIIVLMTDGDNSQGGAAGYDGRYAYSSPTPNERMINLCTAVKNYGIILYTMDIIDGNASLLQSCATSASYFYMVTSSSGIAPALASITADIQSLRLTR